MEAQKLVYVYFEYKGETIQCSSFNKVITPAINEFLKYSHFDEDLFGDDTNGFIEVDESFLSNDLDPNKTYAIRCLMLGADDDDISNFAGTVDHVVCTTFFDYVGHRLLENNPLTTEEKEEIMSFVLVLHTACDSVNDYRWSIGLLKYDEEGHLINTVDITDAEKIAIEGDDTNVERY